MDIQEAIEKVGRVLDEMGKVIIGQEHAIEEVAVALLAGGHALLEGVPGTGKTLTGRALARVTGMSYKRIQFTPDLMPTDIVGVNMYNTATGEFVFRPGPVFADVVLADEINRAPAKTQSALLEAMQDRQVTVDGVPHEMSALFTVLATQNPVEFEGTYPLPEAEVDRFMLKVLIDYPPEEGEVRILDIIHEGFDPADLSTAKLAQAFDARDLLAARAVTRGIHVEQRVRQYITRIVRATRSMPKLMLGASPRAGVMLMGASKAQALINGRDFVTPDDVKAMAPATLRHRLILLPEVEVEGRTSDDCIRELLAGIEVPR